MGENIDLVHLMTKLILQLALIIISAKFLGYIASRFLKQSSVLGELVAGMIIGPYALGGIAFSFLGNEALFHIPEGSFLPVSPELNGFATLASIILLFISGLETDLRTFLRFAGTGMLVGLGGIIVTFFLGAGVALFFIPDVTHLMDPKALFIGVISTATSVGLTARILSEKRQLSSPEGVTILSAAVFDDVLGIIVLAIVIGVVNEGHSQGAFQWAPIAFVALKAFGFWIGSTALGIFLAPRLTKGLKTFRDMEFLAMFTLGIALLLAGISEMMGLAMVIGAYVIGLAFSRTDVADAIREMLEGLYGFMVPIFFCVMGMMVDFSVMHTVAGFGLIYILLSMVGKIFGSGLMALFGGFNLRGAFRIGVGMLPRGEITLIVAGLGLSSGVLDSGVFGVMVLVVFVSSVVAPPVIMKAFDGGSGYKGSFSRKFAKDVKSIPIAMPNASMIDFITSHFISAFKKADFFPRKIHAKQSSYIIQKDRIRILLTEEEDKIIFWVPLEQEAFVRFLITEELLTLNHLMKSVEQMGNTDSMGREIIGKLFGESPSQAPERKKDE